MTSLQPCRYARTGVPPRVHHVLAVMVLRVIQQCLESRLREAPSAGIQRLFLRPHDILGVWVHVEVFLQLRPREGVELLDACDGSVFVFLVGTVLVQSGVDLTGAEDDAFDVFGLVDFLAVLGVGNDPLEMRVAGEIFDR